MTRWFRWYEQTCEDGKFRAVARLSRVTVRDVIALWAFLLEDAANLEHRGVCQRNEDFMSSVLDFEDGTVERILEAMEDLKMVSVGHGAITVINWGKRQFESDADPTASRRQRDKRNRDKGSSHDPVTRDTGGSDTDTDTEAEKKESKKEMRADARRAKGTRLPVDWRPDEVAKQYALSLGVPLEAETEKFRDYWHARAGPGGLKADWAATWRMWCRNSLKFNGNVANGKAQTRLGAAVERRRAEIEEAIRSREMRTGALRLIQER
jgi:hypothetical protein